MHNSSKSALVRSRVLAYPMHGQTKLSAEGYRTRDGHLIEWMGRLIGDVTVVSRPEPVPLSSLPLRGRALAPGTRSVRTNAKCLPLSLDRRRWWPRSAGSYPILPAALQGVPVIVWNPFTALAPGPRNPFTADRPVVLDLLDDWSRHFAFATIRPEVERAYRAAFARADHVTANGEGTEELARRFGRTDVHLIPNGCDPGAFDTTSRATGPTTVGYVGKIGRRLDLEGVIATVQEMPEVHFHFAGPILDKEYEAPLRRLPNLTLLGDVHYDAVPELLRTFDVGWVPHRVGTGEVGGDVIKTYEYRAAGLPVLSTRIDGAGGRGLDGVTAAPMERHAAVLRTWTAAGARLRRQPTVFPTELTWRHKAETIADLLGLERRNEGGGPCAS